MKTVRILTILLLALTLLAWQPEISNAEPIGSAWTYQGRLMDTNDPADGIYDFEFELYDAPNGGVQEGNTIDVNDLDVINGYFTVELDFGSDVFDGNDRWLQIGVRPGDSNNLDPFVTLSPRQEVTPTPYALYAASGPGVPVPLDLSGSVTYPGTVIKGTNTGTGRAVYGIHNSSGNFGYLGHSDRGVYGYSINDYGVRGHGGSYGVYGSSSDGYGVYGKHYSENYGFLGSDLFGVYGKHDSSGNFGYLGYSNRGACGISSDGYGVYGSSISDTGVYGVSSTGTGVYGRCDNGFGGYFIGAKNYFVGNVGLGTTSPGAGLHLKGSGYPSSFMYLQSNSGQDTGIRLYEGDTEKWHIFNSSSDGGLMICNNAYSPVLFADQSTGNVRVRVLEITGGDLVEGFDTGDDTCKPGTVMVIDSKNPGQLAPSTTAYDRKVAGVVSGAGDVSHGIQMGKQEGLDGDTLVAMTGRVYCLADASNGEIIPGDLLTTSQTAGHAMKVTDHDRANGAILGKAMTGLEAGEKGLVLVLVALQ